MQEPVVVFIPAAFFSTRFGMEMAYCLFLLERKTVKPGELKLSKAAGRIDATLQYGRRQILPKSPIYLHSLGTLCTV